MEVYDTEKIQSFKRLGVTVECMTAYGKQDFFNTKYSVHILILLEFITAKSLFLKYLRL